ncbi:MAG: pancreas/duodenum homeobox protein 1 [Desulfonatronovibrio sp.]
MNKTKAGQIFTREKMESLFPIEKSNAFFEALYGGSEESHFDIQLEFQGTEENNLIFLFNLVQRPGGCLSCSMTYGLPNVLARHPVINISGLVHDIASALGIDPAETSWTLGNTRQESSEMHRIPLVISVNP